MKKIVSVVLIAVFVVSLCACGGNGNGGNNPTANVKTYRVGETVSTDIIDFTLNSAQFALYASSATYDYMQPMTEPPQGLFTASTGHSFVAFTATINNKDRTSLGIGAIGQEDWELNMKVKYKGTEYPLKGYDLNDKDGCSFGMDLQYAAFSSDGGVTYEMQEYKHVGHLMLAGDPPLTIRTIGVITVEPESLTDPFELTISVLNSAGETEDFTYSIR